jgi:predicted RNA-binding Zn-ribbon protein involved in translation (DUF1610 family)
MILILEIIAAILVIQFIIAVVTQPICESCGDPFMEKVNEFEVKRCFNCGEITLGKFYKKRQW